MRRRRALRFGVVSIVAVAILLFGVIGGGVSGCGGERSYPGVTGNSTNEAFSPTSTNVIAIHKSTSPQYRIDCLTCHSDILTQTTLSSSVPDVHSAMMPYTPGATNNDKCVYCHTNTDVEQYSAGNLWRNVDVRQCDRCHGPKGPSTKQYYQK